MTVPTDPLYFLQWHFQLIGDIQSIWDDYDGSGVNVGVYDDGVQYSHPDLDGNYDPSLHLNVGGTLFDGVNVGNNGHGTSVAGLIAGEMNGEGGVGVAHGASITGVNIFDPLSALYINAAVPTGFYDAIAQSANFNVVNNSWGSTPGFAASQNINVAGSFAAQTAAGWDFAADNGRGGLGTVIVKSSGNDNKNSNGESLNSSRHTITVAAARDDGFASSYSNYGADTLVTAPAGDFASLGGLGIVTTDLLGDQGYNLRADPTGLHDYTDDFGGTSAAGPIVAGVTTLMLDANENLGWRDVQNILALSATHTGSAIGAATPGLNENNTWFINQADNWNGGGMHYSEDYGYGMVNAYNAVRMAEVWSLFGASQTSGNEVHYTTSGAVNLAIPDLGSVSAQFSSFGSELTEHMTITVTLTHTFFTDLRIFLVASDGTEIMLANGSAGSSSTSDAGITWSFGVDALRGVALNNSPWTIRIDDVVGGDSGTFTSFSVDWYGRAASIDNVYHYTDEAVLMGFLDPTRRSVVDTNGGIDWLNMAAMTGNLLINLNQMAYSSVNGGQLFRMAAGTDIENVVTGDGNDTILGNLLANELRGMRGMDWLSGQGGNDTLYGGAGGDRLYGEGDADTLYGDGGNDVVNGGGGNDILYGGADDDLMGGVSGNDRIYGEDGDDSIFGNDGIDVVNGGAGNDNLHGGAGNDVMGGVSGNDLMYGGAGADTMYGNDGADRMYGDDQDDTLYGGTGADLLNGGSGNDRLYGEDHDDTLGGAAGSDLLNGGAGNDTLYGNDGDDTLGGAEGDDLMYGGVGLDAMYGNGGIDRLYGEDDADTLYGHEGNDVINGGAGNDFLYGGVGNDVMGGAGGADRLYGEADNDELYGNDAADMLFGDVGADRLTGGSGDDYLNGGADADRFIFDDGWGNDVIANFDDGADKFDLTAVAGLTSFGQLNITYSGGSTYVEFNGDEFRIFAVNIALIDSGDFLL